MTACAGNSITHDNAWNPVTYYNGDRFTWTQRRKLESVVIGNSSTGSAAAGTAISYTYNSSGIRTSKTVGTGASAITTEYTLDEDRVIKASDGTDTVWFSYDESGAPVSMRLNNTLYLYTKNLQGDITGIVDTAGTKLVSYVYDAWGKVTAANEAGTSAGTQLIVTNPHTYRGYWYDRETGLYYVSSRYYDPEIGRFINADAAIGQIGNIQGMNMFTYCFNNPVNMSDPTGNWPKLSTVFAVVAAAAITVAAVAAVVVSCGAAAPALAVAGGEIAGGVSAGTIATVAAVGSSAVTVAKAAAVTSAASYVAEKLVEKTVKRNNSVYVLRDDAGTVQYVGRTTDVAKRAKAHEANPARAGLELVVIQSNLNYAEARAIEQAAMVYYHTINTANKMNNQINGISSFNPKLGDYKEAALGVLGYAWNQVSNEILYWTGN